MQITLDSSDKATLLVSMCSRMGLSADEILSMYLMLEDKIFFLFDLLQGKLVKFPSMRSFHRSLSLVDSLNVVKLPKSHYLINGVDSYKEDIKPGDEVLIDGNIVKPVSYPLVCFEDTYILVKEKKNE